MGRLIFEEIESEVGVFGIEYGFWGVRRNWGLLEADLELFSYMELTKMGGSGALCGA